MNLFKSNLIQRSIRSDLSSIRTSSNCSFCNRSNSKDSKCTNSNKLGCMDSNNHNIHRTIRTSFDEDDRYLSQQLQKPVHQHLTLQKGQILLQILVSLIFFHYFYLFFQSDYFICEHKVFHQHLF